MASFEQLPSGKWRAVIRIQGKKHSQAFDRKVDAQAWATLREHDRLNGGLITNMPDGTVAHHIQLYRDKLEKKKQWGSTKECHLRNLTRDLGHVEVADLKQRTVMDYAIRLGNKMNGESILQRISYLNEVFKKAAVLWGVHDAVAKEIQKAIDALRAHDIVYVNEGRERRTNSAEIDRIKDASYASLGPASIVPLAEMLHILEVLPLRTGELLKIKWADFNEDEKTVWLRARKDPNPRKKARNDQKIPLPTIRGRDTWKLLFVDRPREGTDGPFDYLSNTVASLFIRARKRADIQDLHMHDLRAHAITEMMLAGVKLTTIMRISGHKNYKVMLGRYARINPQAVADEIELLMNDQEKAELKLVA